MMSRHATPGATRAQRHGPEVRARGGELLIDLERVEDREHLASADIVADIDQPALHIAVGAREDRRAVNSAMWLVHQQRVSQTGRHFLAVLDVQPNTEPV